MGLWIPVVEWLASFFVDSILSAGVAGVAGHHAGQVAGLQMPVAGNVNNLFQPDYAHAAFNVQAADFVEEEQLLILSNPEIEEFAAANSDSGSDSDDDMISSRPRKKANKALKKARLAREAFQRETAESEFFRLERLRLEQEELREQEALRDIATAHAQRSVGIVAGVSGGGTTLAVLTALVASNYNVSHPVANGVLSSGSMSFEYQPVEGYSAVSDSGLSVGGQSVSAPPAQPAVTGTTQTAHAAKGLLGGPYSNYWKLKHNSPKTRLRKVDRHANTNSNLNSPVVTPTSDVSPLPVVWGPFVLPPPPRREWMVAYANPNVYDGIVQCGPVEVLYERCD